MSFWTYAIGTIRVEPRGRTFAEKEYILKTVLSHLPRVSGSEGDMNVYINAIENLTSSSNCDEFLNRSNLGNGYHGLFEMPEEFVITIQGAFRDREFSETMKEMSKWLHRLAKRLFVFDVIVNVYSDMGERYIFTNDYQYFSELYDILDEDEDKPKWTDYLMWDYDRNEEGKLLSGKPNKHRNG